MTFKIRALKQPHIEHRACIGFLNESFKTKLCRLEEVTNTILIYIAQCEVLTNDFNRRSSSDLNSLGNT